MKGADEPPARRPDSSPRQQANHGKGLLLALVSTFLFSNVFITAKFSLEAFNPTTFGLVWLSSAAIFSLIIIIFSGRVGSLTISLQSLGVVLAMGLLTGIGMILAWAALSRLDPSFAAFLWRFYPIMALFLSIIVLKEKLRLVELLPVGFLILGGLISVLDRWELVGTGMILALLSCLAGAVNLVIAKKAVAEIAPLTLAVYSNAFGASAILIWGIVGNSIYFGVATRHWMACIAGAFFGPCLGQILRFQSYRFWGLSRSSIVMTIEPLFVLPLAFLFLGKLPTAQELLGGGLILLGAIWLASLRHLANRHERR